MMITGFSLQGAIRIMPGIHDGRTLDARRWKQLRGLVKCSRFGLEVCSSVQRPASNVWPLVCASAEANAAGFRAKKDDDDAEDDDDPGKQPHRAAIAYLCGA